MCSLHKTLFPVKNQIKTKFIFYFLIQLFARKLTVISSEYLNLCDFLKQSDYFCKCMVYISQLKFGTWGEDVQEKQELE